MERPFQKTDKKQKGAKTSRVYFKANSPKKNSEVTVKLMNF